LCREHGQQLMELAAEENLNGFGLFGLIKETGVDDEGLLEFHSNSFPFPLYRDEGLVFYNEFFGTNKLGLPSYNPLRLYRGYKKMTARLNKKGLEGNLKGEGILQGGIVIFGKDGEAKFAYKEETGTPLPVDEIKAAIEAVKDDKNEL
jgi:hypothetical protein